MVSFNDVSLDTTDYLSEQEYDRKKAGIVSQITGEPISVLYSRGVNICWKTKKGFTIEKAKPKLKGIDGNSAINHELAHVLFDSFDDRALKTIEEWGDEWMPNISARDIAMKVYHEAMNVIEDQRIESLWGKIYLGNVKDFVKVRKNLGKELEYVDHPSLVLLAERFFRFDYVKKSKYGFVGKYIHQVEGKDIQATMVILRKIKPYLDESIDTTIKKREEAQEAQKEYREMDNSYRKEGRGDTIDERVEKRKQLDESKEKMYDKHQEVEKETFVDVNRNDSVLRRDSGALKEKDKEETQPYTEDELGTNGYEESLAQLESDANDKISDIRGKMEGSDTMPVAPVYVREKLLKRERGIETIPDSKVVKEISNMLRMFKERTKTRLAEEGSELDIEGYIDLKANGFGECFIRDEASNGLSICLSVDGSGSMRRHNPIVRQLVSTLWEATKSSSNIDIKCITWSSDRRGDMRIQRYENSNDIQYLDEQDGGYTPTHFGIERGSQELSKMKGRRKLLIVITDGFPNYKKNGIKVRRDVTAKETIKSYKKALKVTPNIAVIGVGDVWGDYTMKDMFKRYTKCRTMRQVSTYVTGTLKKEIIRVMKK
tara:strand:+ start:1057 stop:2859 length:1803 start_codon:yes stop_codon:yes gene_type:complete